MWERKATRKGGCNRDLCTCQMIEGLHLSHLLMPSRLRISKRHDLSPWSYGSISKGIMGARESSHGPMMFNNSLGFDP